jgi:DNA-binding IclR family transcriptional regulator
MIDAMGLTTASLPSPAGAGRRRPRRAAGRQTSGAESARKVLSVLLCFDAKRPHATIEELAVAVGAPLSTTYRYVALLKEMGLLSDDGNGRYFVASTLLRLSDAARAAISYPELARSEVDQLAAETGETVLLIQAIGKNGVCIGKAESPHSMRLAYDLGAALPLHRGAAPKVLLAHLPASERERYLQGIADGDPSARADVQRLRTELERIRRNGAAYSRAEITSGVWAVAVPIFEREKVVLALSVAGPAFRLKRPLRPAIEQALREAAARLSTLLTELVS